jgi:predicted porin
LGRIGFGYIYPEFRTHITYKTPNINGFQIELGVFDPQEPMNTSFTSGYYETNKPQFQAEATYNTNFQGGSLSLWIDGIWQEMEDQVRHSSHNDTATSSGYDVGGEVSFSGITVTGNYYAGQGLGMGLFNAVEGRGFQRGSAGVASAGTTCNGSGCFEADNDGYYIQAAYTFGKTKFAGSYGESTQDGENFAGFGRFRYIDNDMWVVGVYHDLTPWLKLVAEYAETNSKSFDTNFDGTKGGPNDEISSDVVSLGGFIFW